MGYAKHVGRVGALAVALGIGAAVATTPGVAWADGTTDEKAPVTESDTNQNPDTADTPTFTQDPGAAIRKNIERAAGDPRAGISNAIKGVVTSSGGAITSTHRTGSNANRGNTPPVVDKDNSEPPKSAPQTFVNNANDAPNVFTPRWHAPQAQVSTKPAPKPVPNVLDDVKQSIQQAVGALTGNQPAASTIVQRNAISTLNEPSVEDTPAVRAPFVAPVKLITGVLDAALAPFLNTPPGQPAPQNPILWAVLGWVRRQVQDTPFGKFVLNRTPEITTPEVVDNHDGTFTITPSADDVDPDGDNLMYTATNGTDGTVVKNDDGTFTYKVTDLSTWDKSDTITLTASDESAFPHVHGLAGLFSPDGGHTDSVVVTIAADDGSLPPPPDVVQAPTERDDGSGNFDTVLQYNPDTVSNVEAAPEFQPKYWTVVSETYDPDTGKYTAVLKPTQAGQLRAALGLDTTDELKLNVTNASTPQTFSMRTMALAAPAEDPPDQALVLPTPPGAVLQVDDPSIQVGQGPAGVVVTDKFAYVVNSTDGTVSVIGADPNDPSTYNKVLDMDPNDGEGDVDPIDVGGSPLFATASGGNLYVVNAGDGTVTVIDTADNPIVGDPIDAGVGSFNALASPDGKRLYVINSAGSVSVIDTDPQSVNYLKVLDVDPNTVGVQSISVAPPPDADSTDGITFGRPFSGQFNEDGSRLYITRIYATQVREEDGTTRFVYEPGDLVVIDTATNTVVGDPIELEQYPGYVSSNGERLYLTSLNPDDIDAYISNSGATPLPGHVTVVDVDPDSPTYNTEIDQIDVGKIAVNVAMSPDGSLAYVVNAGDGTVSVIDTATNEVIATFTYDPNPSGQFGDASFIAISPDGNRLYATRYLDGEVVAISIAPSPEEV